MSGWLRDADRNAALLAGPAYEKIVIWGEENAAIGNNQFEYSFGNGATGFIGIPVPEDWELYAVSADLESSSGGLPTLAVVDMGANAASSNDLHAFTMTGLPHTEILGSPVPVPAGTLVGFRTVVTGGGSHTDARIGAWLRREAGS